jgi:hypothetical protein
MNTDKRGSEQSKKPLKHGGKEEAEESGKAYH